MRLAPVDAPLDELRVVPRSILVRDGGAAGPGAELVAASVGL